MSLEVETGHRRGAGTEAAAAPEASVRPVLTRREHQITNALATWMLVGLLVDGWAHRTQDLHDSITTKYHALLYTGFLSFAAWLVWLYWREHRNGLRGSQAMPEGYMAGLVGVIIFGTGAFFDQFWHLAWGIEQDLNSFFSPTHWCLAIGMFLMVSCAWRAGALLPGPEREGIRAFAPWLWSIVLTATMTSFFISYLNLFASDLPTVEPEFLRHLPPETPDRFNYFTIERLRALGVANIILTTAILMAVAMHAVRRWRLPFGTLTLAFGVATGSMLATWEFFHGWTLIAALIGGLTADVLVARWDPKPSNLLALRRFAAAVPAVMWASYYGVLKLFYAVEWPAELWTGSITMAALTSLILSYLMEPGRLAVEGGVR